MKLWKNGAEMWAEYEEEKRLESIDPKRRLRNQCRELRHWVDLYVSRRDRAPRGDTWSMDMAVYKLFRYACEGLDSRGVNGIEHHNVIWGEIQGVIDTLGV